MSDFAAFTIWDNRPTIYIPVSLKHWQLTTSNKYFVPEDSGTGELNRQSSYDEYRELDGNVMKQTAGTLLYRFRKKHLEVLLVHPSGNYNKKSPWSIPKGLPDEGEDFEEAARRETEEETGVVAGELEALGYVEYTKSRKRVHCFWGPSPEDANPSCTSWEVDRAEFVDFDDAKKLIHPDQFALLLRLEDLLNSGRPKKSKK